MRNKIDIKKVLNIAAKVMLVVFVYGMLASILMAGLCCAHIVELPPEDFGASALVAFFGGLACFTIKIAIDGEFDK